MRCLVATLGADAPGINAAVRAVTRTAIRRGLNVYGAKQGWLGLLSGKVWQLSEADVGSVLSRGGSVLGSTDRKIERSDRESHARIAESLKRFDLVVATGGLGSFAVLNRIYAEHNMGLTTTLFLPASVEAEFLDPAHGTDGAGGVHAEAIGADTAGNRAVTAIDCLRDQAFHSRTVFIVECVGTKSNYLPIQVGLACGAQRIYLPLYPPLSDEAKADIQGLYGTRFDPNFVDVGELIAWIESMFEADTRRTYLLVVLPSGVPLVDIRNRRHAHGGVNYEEMMTSVKPFELTVLRVAEALDVHFSSEISVQVRHVLLDDLQRGGPPTLRDRMLGSLYGEAAVEEFLSLVRRLGDDTHRGNLNLIAVDGTNRVAWKCLPRSAVLPLFQGANPRAGGLDPLPFFRQARGVVSGYRPLAMAATADG